MLFHNEVHELGFRIRFAGEIAAKVRNKELARYFWSENDTGGTWELMYFIVNEERTDVPIQKVNPLFGYQPHFRDGQSGKPGLPRRSAPEHRGKQD
jgi:hypothetical protein